MFDSTTVTVDAARGDAHIERILRIVACPRCQGDLLSSDKALTCPTCKGEYPLRGGVPDFTGGQPDACSGFEYQWEARRQGQFESEKLYGKSAEYELAQFFTYLKIDPNDASGLHVLDGGCGSGRLVQMLAGYDLRVVGIDFTSSVVAIDKEMRARGVDRLSLIQGDLLHIPLRRDQFDVIWSGGVIHHTGDTRLAVKNLVRVLKPGGRLFVWVYSVDQGIFGRVRQVLPFAHRLSHRSLHALCRALAIPIWTLGVAARRPHPMNEVVFKLFDHLSPKYRTVHTDEEMIEWFLDEGMTDIQILESQATGGIGILGTKPLNAPA